MQSRPPGVTCPKCGRQLPAGAKFCGFDGTAIGGAPAPQRTGQQPAAALEKVCPKCQAAYPASALFCPVEGARLVSRADKPGSGGKISTPDDGEDALYSVDEGSRLPVTELIGQTVGKYKIEEFIGEGGMALVYRAVHTAIERPVVIKVLQGRLLNNEKSVKRFERECKVTAKVNHPNVVSVFDVGFINGNQPYLVMEYIKGESLRDKIDREGPLSLAAVAAIFIQVCRGMQEAHSLGIIHRDLKPENILLQERSDRPDWVKIVDFGIAHIVASGQQRLTKTGSVVGTAEYMAPEQLRDLPIDARSDIYGIGVVMAEALTAQMPFAAETTEALLLKILMDDPCLPSQYRKDIPPGSPFDVIVAKALMKDPDTRYQTATEMRLDLEQLHNQLMLRRSL